MNRPLCALIVEDSEDDAQLVLRTLRRGGFEVTSTRVDTPDAMQEAICKNTWDVVLCDYSMPHFSGPAALELLKASGLDIPFLIVSGKIGEEKAVEMMRSGACDYILKDNLIRLIPDIERELRQALDRREHKQLEIQWHQAQKMEALGRLAGGVAHEFNNLLTIIYVVSEQLSAKLGPDDPSRPLLHQIEKAADRSASLASKLLQFSGKQAPSPRLLDLNAVISDAEKVLGPLIGEDIELVTDLAARLRNIKADPGQMTQMLFDLAINARDAMPQGGRITISTRNITLEEGYSRPLPEMPLGDYVLLEVADTGVGMPPEVMAHLFEPFFTTKEAGKGTGLELATVFGIVKQNAGHVAVRSQPGAGASFCIYFPEATVSTLEANSRPRTEIEADLHGNEIEASVHGNEVVLLAEDDESICTLINPILVNNGYTVLEAKNGKQALGLAGKYRLPIHILIADVVMPEMGGVELSQQVRKIHPETKTLFVSGYPPLPVIAQDALTGKVEFMPKPLSPKRLLSKVREMIDTPQPQSPAQAERLTITSMPGTE